MKAWEKKVQIVRNIVKMHQEMEATGKTVGRFTAGDIARRIGFKSPVSIRKELYELVDEGTLIMFPVKRHLGAIGVTLLFVHYSRQTIEVGEKVLQS